MSDITQCPECQRKLNVPDGQLGTAVRCPACGAEFTAERYVPPRPELVTPEPDPEPPRAPPRRDYPDRGPGRRDYDDRDDDYPDRPRSRYGRGAYGRGYYGAAHRGSTVQTLGILCLCFCWTTVPCWIMGIMALVMASQDLSAMDRGAMDQAGRGQIKTGQVCAIIGLCVSVLLIFSCCGLNLAAVNLR